LVGTGAGVVVEDVVVVLEVVEGSSVGDGVVVVVVVGLWTGEVVEEVVVSSGVHSPSTQYDLPTWRSGQVTPGLILVKRSREVPQAPAKVSQVSPLSAGISKKQSTPRRECFPAATNPGPERSPAAMR
jgi:hypothetical protein